jgi:transposase
MAPNACWRNCLNRSDGGYDGADFQTWVKDTFDVDLEISLRPRDKKGFVLVPQRGVVERSFAWFGRSRRLSKDYLRHEASQVIVLEKGEKKHTRTCCSISSTLSSRRAC